jgi:hypothetical protein
MFKKVLLAGVLSAVVSLGVAGIGTTGTASADGPNDNICVVQANGSVNPACWQGVIWGGFARGWVPQAGYFNNNAGTFGQVYWFLNYYNPYWWNWNWNWTSNQVCWNGNTGFWNNGVWATCGVGGFWMNGIWYPF